MATVSDTNTETTLQLYANPLLIQDKQLSLFEQHVFDGKVVLDGNNVFTFGLEMGASLAAGIVNEMTNNFQTLYPARAQTMSDLYRHLSDYDYVDMYSTPSTTTIELMFERNFMVDNAPADADEDGSYKIIIPEFSTFMIGNHQFGIHYPIEIKLRKAYKSDGKTVDYDKCMFHCIWNTETVNPLYRLNTNILEHRMFSKNGLTFLCISIPIHQFSVAIKKEDTVSSTGFIKRYPYNNRFYAIRIFHYWNNQWVEMAETLSDVIYNPQVLTAKVKVLSDIRTVEVSIPQSYFTSGMIGNRIMCMLYTTEGSLDVDIRNYSTDQFSASFLIDDTVIDDTYSAFLKRIPYLQVVPLATRISNGSNGKTFEEMKNRVMNSVGGDDLLVTPKQLEAHLSDTGFKVSKYIDNITDRIYIASKEITDTNKDVVGTGEFMTTFDYSMFNNGEYDSLLSINSNAHIILPTAIFKYDEKSNSMIMLSRYEIKKLLKDSTTEQMIKELNSNVYTFTPYHIKLVTNSTLPMAGAFDLMDPTISNISFIGENKATSTQLSMYGSVLLHADKGRGGYKFTVALYKTSDISNTPFTTNMKDNIAVILRTTNTEGAPIYLRGTYIGKNDANMDLVEFHIQTNYKITDHDSIDTQNFTIINDTVVNPSENYIYLNQDFELLFFAHRDLMTDPDAITESNAQSYIPRTLRAEDMVWLATQKMTIKLGESISSLKTNVFMTLTGKEYQSYETTEFATYAANIYKRYDEDVRNDAGEIIHNKGELIIDDDGKLIVQKYAGDLVITSSDNSVVGLCNPSCRISSTSVDENNNKVVESETLFLDSDHLTPTAQPSNNWYPFRTYQTTSKDENGDDVKVWRAVYTGTKHRATVIEIKDLFKWIKEDSESDVNLTLQYATQRYRSYTFDSTTNKYSLNQPIQGSFIYVNDDREDIRLPRYWAYVTNVENVINYHLDDLVKLGKDRASYLGYISTGGVYGALYQRNPEYSDFDYTQYVTEDELCRIFKALDELNTPTSEYRNEKAIIDAFDLDTNTFDKLKNFRDPWIKLIESEGVTEIDGETKGEGFKIVSEYWRTREYVNFNDKLVLKTHTTYSVSCNCGKLNGYTHKGETCDECNTIANEVSTVSGLEALAYLQERSMNPNVINHYDDQAEGLEHADTDTSYRLIWINNYVRDEDTTKVSAASLIDDIIIDSSAGESTGALVWGTHKEGESKHYIVVTGPSFIECYNKLMNCQKNSGYMYEATVYSPENIYTVGYSKDLIDTEIITDESGKYIEAATELELYNNLVSLLKSNDVVERYTAIIPTKDEVSGQNYTCLAFLDVVWQSHWPWEMTNWFVDKYPIKQGISGVGKLMSSVGISMAIDKENTDAKILHYIGDIQLDKDGKPAEATDKERKIIYHVNMIHCDYKPIESDQKDHKLYKEDIQELLRSYFNTLENTRPLLLERTNLYFSPIKSLGYGDFKGSNGAVISMPVELSVGLRIYISNTTAGSQDSKDLIKANIIQIIEDHITSGNISCTVLAETIRQSMSDTVLYVDVLGINGNQDVQTLISLDPSQSAVRLKSILVLNEDNTISVEKDVNIEWAILQ